jgi:DNA polymerase-3 subunit gamma/tau
MEYRVTARKYRPQFFRDIIGQENLVQALLNALSSGRIPHAYLFSGARGVGKTTTARILAKALNCKNRKDGEPCNECPSCVEITNGSSLDVVEIDGASNRGIDSIRQIRENVAYRALSGMYRIYIIDEVHMLTKEASNALLKTLEEPPEHVVFILATTEPHNVLPTIRSRCQHYIYKKIPVRTVMSHLSSIAKAEGVEADEDGLYLVAAAGDGSMRDAQSIFDQVVLYANGKITEATAAEVIGMPENTYFSDAIEAVKSGDVTALLRVEKSYLENAGDVKLFVRGMLGYLRTALLAKRLPPADDLLDLTEAKYQQITALFTDFTQEDISRIMGLFTDAWKELKGDANEKFELEIALFRMMDYKNLIPISDIRSELLALLNKGGGASPVQQASRRNAAPVRNEPENDVPAPEEETPDPQQQLAFHRQPFRQETPPVERIVFRQESPPQKKPPVQTSQENQPLQYRKLQIDRPNQESATPASAPLTTEVDLRNALLKAMNSHIIMKTLTPQVAGVTEMNGGLRVELKSAHAFEYLSQNRKDLETALERFAGRAVPLTISQGTADQPPKTVKTAETAATIKPREEKPPTVETVKPAATPVREEKPAPTQTPVPPKREAPSADPDDPVNIIADLFDGKIRK